LQQRKFDARDLKAADAVTSLRRRVGIGVGQRMTKMLGEESGWP